MYIRYGYLVLYMQPMRGCPVRYLVAYGISRARPRVCIINGDKPEPSAWRACPVRTQDPVESLLSLEAQHRQSTGGKHSPAQPQYCGKPPAGFGKPA